MHILLGQSIDYAGLFPPAGLGMTEAVGNYASSRNGPRAWALARFVLPVSRIEEFEAAAGDLLPRGPAATPWLLSVLGGLDGSSDIECISAFNRRHSPDTSIGVAVIDTVELKVRSTEEIHHAHELTSQCFQTYLEVPLTEETPDLIEVIAACRGRAKVRTGGVSPEQFPSPLELAQFIYWCARAQVPFKATAGLHHPFRAIHPLNYHPASASTTMHGFVNVLIAAAFALVEMDLELVEMVLADQDISSFKFDDKGISWSNHRLSNDQLGEMRRRLALSFGSCSFHEPIDDLSSLDLL